MALGILIPRGLGVIDCNLGEEKIFDKIKAICEENEVDKIVVGLPMRSQGEIGALGEAIKSFSQRLSETINLPIYFENEQFSSSEAESLIGKIDKNTRKSGKVDELAAVLILERFLERKEDINPDIEPKR